MENVRKVLFVVLFALSSGVCLSQSKQPQYKIVGNEIVKVQTKSMKDSTATSLTHTIKGVVYPVFKTSKGGYFVSRISQKSGRAYRQYLPLN